MIDYWTWHLVLTPLLQTWHLVLTPPFYKKLAAILRIFDLGRLYVDGERYILLKTELGPEFWTT